jgi:hypothetical protein
VQAWFDDARRRRRRIAQHAKGDLVVYREDGGDLGLGGKREAVLVAGSGGSIAVKRRVRLDTGGLERCAPAVDPAVCAEPIARSGDMRDGTVPGLEQQARDGCRAGLLVERGNGDCGSRNIVDRHDRRGGLSHREMLGDGLLRGVEHDALDALTLESLDRVEDDALVETFDARDADRVSVRMSGTLDREPGSRRGRTPSCRR